MSLRAALARAAKRAPAPTEKVVSVLAPQGSINTVAPSAGLPDGDCLDRWNLIPSEYGNRVRLGEREWVTGLGEEVRSILPFHAAVNTNDKLFAATQTGIWDVTASDALTYGAGPAWWPDVIPFNTYSPAALSGPHYFVVTAIVSGAETLPSLERSAVTSGVESLAVGWQEVAGAEGYRVYHGTSPGGESEYWSVAAPAHSFIYSGQVGTPRVPPSVTSTRALTWGVQDAASGHCSSAQMTTAAGHFLLVADESNGLRMWSESGAAWSTPAITGVSAASIAFVAVWKSRVWMVEKNTGRAWYLAANAISGAATSFNFGAHAPHGGELRGLWSWTYDGGNGVDDSLVGVFSSGDVVVYQGTDPDTVGAFENRGVYYVGAVPAGRKIASSFGGDLLVMSTTGLVPMSKLVLGSVQGDASQYATLKIGNLWNRTMLTRSSVLGWQMVLHPQDATMIVIAPVAAGAESEQFVMSTLTKGWSRYRDLGMGVCAATWSGSLYFGTADGRVKVMDGTVDGVTLADPSSYEPIEWALLTAYTNLGTARKKRLHWVKASFQSDSAAPTYAIEGRYDGDLSEVLSAPTGTRTPGALWDSAIWDTSKWAGAYSPTTELRGLAGIGSRVALAIKGQSTGRTVLEQFEVAYDEAGAL